MSIDEILEECNSWNRMGSDGSEEEMLKKFKSAIFSLIQEEVGKLKKDTLGLKGLHYQVERYNYNYALSDLLFTLKQEWGLK